MDDEELKDLYKYLNRIEKKLKYLVSLTEDAFRPPPYHPEIDRLIKQFNGDIDAAVKEHNRLYKLRHGTDSSKKRKSSKKKVKKDEEFEKIESRLKIINDKLRYVIDLLRQVLCPPFEKELKILFERFDGDGVAVINEINKRNKLIYD